MCIASMARVCFGFCIEKGLCGDRDLKCSDKTLELSLFCIFLVFYIYSASLVWGSADCCHYLSGLVLWYWVNIISLLFLALFYGICTYAACAGKQQPEEFEGGW